MKSLTQRNISKRLNLNDMVVDYIKEGILSGLYKSGDRILEKQLSNELNISRAPIREGIMQLEKEGIVTVIPRKGTYIREFKPEDIQEVFDIRILLENNIIEILINENKLKDSDFKFLNKLVDEMVEIVRSNISDKEKSIQINLKDMEFHRYIWEKSGSKRRVIILDGLFFQLRMAMLYDMEKTGDLLVSATDHYKIIESLQVKDIERSKKELSNHIITYGK